MKRIISIISFLISLVAIAQTNQVINVYAELLGTKVKNSPSGKVTVTIDFGQSVPHIKKEIYNKLVNDMGSDLEFNSMIDALNYMGERGWRFEQAYIVTERNADVYHWLISKKITDSDAINDGFNTKKDFRYDIGFCYVITYLKKPVNRVEWDKVKEEYRCNLTQQDLNEIIKTWKGQTDDKDIYDCIVKKE